MNAVVLVILVPFLTAIGTALLHDRPRAESALNAVSCLGLTAFVFWLLAKVDADVPLAQLPERQIDLELPEADDSQHRVNSGGAVRTHYYRSRTQSTLVFSWTYVERQRRGGIKVASIERVRPGL